MISFSDSLPFRSCCILTSIFAITLSDSLFYSFWFFFYLASTNHSRAGQEGEVLSISSFLTEQLQWRAHQYTLLVTRPKQGTLAYKHKLLTIKLEALKKILREINIYQIDRNIYIHE